MDRRGRKKLKIFLSLERRNYTNKLISTLEINGNIIKDPIKISEAQNQFFETLYAEILNQNDPNYQDSLDELLLNNDMPKLTVEQTEASDKPINESEILKSIKMLSNRKSPGSDGLLSDFYNFIWCDIKYLLTHSIIYAMQKGVLSIEQKRRIITLVPKKSKNRLYLKNWRLISLLNTD